MKTFTIMVIGATLSFSVNAEQQQIIEGGNDNTDRDKSVAEQKSTVPWYNEASGRARQWAREVGRDPNQAKERSTTGNAGGIRGGAEVGTAR